MANRWLGEQRAIRAFNSRFAAAKSIRKRFALLPEERGKACTYHLWRFTGTVPCTGPQVCTLCGTRKEDAEASGT